MECVCSRWLLFVFVSLLFICGHVIDFYFDSQFFIRPYYHDQWSLVVCCGESFLNCYFVIVCRLIYCFWLLRSFLQAFPAFLIWKEDFHKESTQSDNRNFVEIQNILIVYCYLETVNITLDPSWQTVTMWIGCVVTRLSVTNINSTTVWSSGIHWRLHMTYKTSMCFW